MKPRVLVVHNRYVHRGGEDVVVEREVELLRSRGHDVEVWLEDNARTSSIPRALLAAQAVWSQGSYRALQQRLTDFGADVVHFHNTLPLISPSAYYAARSRGAAVVQTLHNYRLVCPAATLLRDGAPCEDCVGRAPIPAVRHRCYRDSVAASAVVASMLLTHRAAGTYAHAVDVYLALTEFVRSRALAGGVPAERIVVKPNFVAPTARRALPGRGRHALFVGRLSPEKGVDVLIDAWKRLGDTAPRLVIAGDGPECDSLRRRAASCSRIDLVGSVSRERVEELMTEASLLVVPSRWYEAFPLVIVEAFAAGLPVVVSALGSLATIVSDGVDGAHAPPNDPDGLAGVLGPLLADPDRRALLGDGAFASWQTRFAPDVNYNQLMAAYANAIARRRGSG